MLMTANNLEGYLIYSQANHPPPERHTSNVISCTFIHFHHVTPYVLDAMILHSNTSAWLARMNRVSFHTNERCHKAPISPICSLPVSGLVINRSAAQQQHQRCQNRESESVRIPLTKRYVVHSPRPSDSNCM